MPDTFFVVAPINEAALKTSHGSISYETALAGGTSTTLASTGTNPNAIAVDSTSVYWVEASNSNNSGTAMKVPLAGGTPTTLASAQTAPLGIALDSTSVYAIAVDSTSVYWVASNSGTVMKATPK